MFSYVLRRILIAIPVLFLLILSIFSIVRLLPGVPPEILAGEESILDQFYRYLADLSKGDLGRSMRTGLPVTKEILIFLPNTLILIVTAIIISIVAGIFVGTIVATKPYSKLDNLFSVGTLFGISLPSWWLGLLLMMLFCVQLGWLPAGGLGGPKHLILPAVTLSIPTLSSIVRYTRSGLMMELHKDYVRTAVSKGLPERIVIFKHALKNALIPVTTIIGLESGRLITEAIVVETVFSWPGIGTLMVNAIFARDLPMIQGCVLLVALFFIFLNMFVDITYAYLDPRIRY